MALVLLAVILRAARAQFDWGQGCDGGSGSFTLRDIPHRDIVEVGEIPAGKWFIEVRLTADVDIDIQLYDLDDTSCGASGKPLIAWYNPTEPCSGCGLLGCNAGPDEVRYHGVTLSYSGYNGVNGRWGDEWIRVEGASPRRFAMKGYAYQKGSAEVHYSWARDQSRCCLGTAPCGGSFEAHVPRNAYALIGDIPVGKKDLEVLLEAPTDLDITLHDRADESSECSTTNLAAVVAWAQDPACRGILGMKSIEETEEYMERTYSYSGFDGVPGPDGQKRRGNEWIEVRGLLNRPLRMQAYGYEEGTATVNYTYREDWPRACYGAIIGKKYRENDESKMDIFVSLGRTPSYAHADSTVTEFERVSVEFPQRVASVAMRNGQADAQVTNPQGSGSVVEFPYGRTGRVATITFENGEEGHIDYSSDRTRIVPGVFDLYCDDVYFANTAVLALSTAPQDQGFVDTALAVYSADLPESTSTSDQRGIYVGLALNSPPEALFDVEFPRRAGGQDDCLHHATSCTVHTTCTVSGQGPKPRFHDPPEGSYPRGCWNEVYFLHVVDGDSEFAVPFETKIAQLRSQRALSISDVDLDRTFVELGGPTSESHLGAAKWSRSVVLIDFADAFADSASGSSAFGPAAAAAAPASAPEDPSSTLFVAAVESHPDEDLPTRPPSSADKAVLPTRTDLPTLPPRTSLHGASGREDGGEGEREFTPLTSAGTTIPGTALILSISGQIAVGLALVVLLSALLRRRTVAERRVTRRLSDAKLARAELGQATMWPEGR